MRHLLSMALLVAGCGDDGGPTDAAVMDAARMDAAQDGGGTDMLSILVVAMADQEPMVGATVALDTPGGRVEQRTGADGKATFDGLDLAQPHTVIAHAAGYAVFSYSELTRDEIGRLRTDGIVETDGSVRLALDRVRDTSGFITLSGTAAGMVNMGNYLAIDSTAESDDFHQMMGAAWQLDVPPGAPLTVVGVEVQLGAATGLVRGFRQDFLQWLTRDIPAPVADTMVALDFATDAVTPEPVVTGSFAVPTSADFFARASANVILRTDFDHGFTALGQPTEITFDMATNRFRYTLQHVDIGTAPAELVTTFVLAHGPRASLANLRGNMTGGDVDPGFIEPIDPVFPEFGIPHSLHDEISWDPVSELHSVAVQVVVDGVVVWVASGPGSATVRAIPEPPSSFDVGALTGTVDGRIVACGWNLGERRCERFAVGRGFELVP